MQASSFAILFFLFALAFAEVSREGLGPRRGRADLLSIAGEEAMSLSLDPIDRPVDRVRVQFVTPTELKGVGELAGQPEFGVLLPRIRDRISTLGKLYGDGPLEMDFRAFADGRHANGRAIHAGVRADLDKVADLDASHLRKFFVASLFEDEAEAVRAEDAP